MRSQSRQWKKATALHTILTILRTPTSTNSGRIWGNNRNNRPSRSVLNHRPTRTRLATPTSHASRLGYGGSRRQSTSTRTRCTCRRLVRGGACSWANGGTPPHSSPNRTTRSALNRLDARACRSASDGTPPHNSPNRSACTSTRSSAPQLASRQLQGKLLQRHQSSSSFSILKLYRAPIRSSSAMSQL